MTDDYAKILHPVDKILCDERYNNLTKIMTLCVDNVKVRIDGMDRALELKTNEMERRLEGLNELRNEVTNDRDQFLRKEVYNDKIAIYDKWVSETSEKVTRMETRYEGRITITTVIAILSILVALASMFIPGITHR